MALRQEPRSVEGVPEYERRVPMPLDSIPTPTPTQRPRHKPSRQHTQAVDASPRDAVGKTSQGQSGHGHGMSENRKPKREPNLPHDRPRDDKQPYAHEVDDYSRGASNPPVSQTEKENPDPRAR
jgi:hypothetical protein